MVPLHRTTYTFTGRSLFMRCTKTQIAKDLREQPVSLWSLNLSSHCEAEWMHLKIAENYFSSVSTKV
jgi:hypothetical protein